MLSLVNTFGSLLLLALLGTTLALEGTGGMLSLIGLLLLGGGAILGTLALAAWTLVRFVR